MKPIASFIEAYEAHIAKGILETAGIPAIVMDELTAQVNYGYSQAIGGVKVAVLDEDAEEAIAILNNQIPD